MPYYTTMFVYGTVLSIRFNIKRNILDGYNETDIIEQWYGTFVSEVYEIIKCNISFRDFIVHPNEIIIILSTPLKKDLDRLFDDIRRINTLKYILNNKFNMDKERAVISFGACYDKMTVTKYGDYDNIKFLWRGSNIEKASLYSNRNDVSNIVIHYSVWKNLQNDNQKLFTMLSNKDETYVVKENILDMAMNNWLINNN